MKRLTYWAVILTAVWALASCSSKSNKSDDCPSSDHSDKEHDDGGHHGISIVSLNIEMVRTPLVLVIWVLLAVGVKVIYHSVERFAKFCPESCVLIIFGLIAGLVLKEMTGDDMLISFDSTTFFLYLLPPIVLDAGWCMPPRHFFDNIGLILAFAIFGTLLNSFGIGLGLHYLIEAGAINVTDTLHDGTDALNKTIDLPGCLLFGSLIAAVDPVAVLAVFDSVHVNEVLHIVVEGESLLNDAVSVVLYRIMTVVVGSEEGLEPKEYGVGFIAFLVISCGGTLIGLVYAIITSLFTRVLTHVRVVEPLVVFFFAYLSYITAELFHWSGILAIIFCGFGMKRYVEENISRKSHTTIKYFMKMLAVISESVIFMFLGLAMVSSTFDINWAFIGWSIILCLVIRSLVVVSFVAISNRFRIQKIAKVDQFIMVYGGLRGAISFSLAFILSDGHAWKNLVITTTYAVIIFTVFVQGITIGPLVKLLHVRTHEKKKPTLNEEIIEHIMAHVMWGFEEVVGKHGENYYRQWFDHIDNTYLMRWFTNKEHDKAAKHGDAVDILAVFHNLEKKDAMELAERNEVFDNLHGRGSKGDETFPGVNTVKAPQLPCVDESVALADPNVKYQKLDTSISVDADEDHFNEIKNRTFAAMKLNARPAPKTRHRRNRLTHAIDEHDHHDHIGTLSEVPIILPDSHHSMPYHQHAPMEKPHHHHHHQRRHHKDHHGHKKSSKSNGHHSHHHGHHHGDRKHHRHHRKREVTDDHPPEEDASLLEGVTEQDAPEKQPDKTEATSPPPGLDSQPEALEKQDDVKMYDFGNTMPEVDPRGHPDEEI